MDKDILSIQEMIDNAEYPFFVPSYQRGYRWGADQAKELLDDIDNFRKNKKNDKEIYLIQPLIIKQTKQLLKRNDNNAEGDAVYEEKDVYNVIDGQQRLTTLFLIMSILFPNLSLYEIFYQTREDSSDYLKKKLDEMSDMKDENIDFFHMYSVKAAVQKWIEGKRKEWKDSEKDEEEEFKNAIKNNVCFIWYEIGDENEADVFKRINLGKIPLTDAELIKGLFLNRYNYEQFGLDDSEIEKKQFIIASEWDKFEYALQNDEFWLFVQNDHSDEGPNKKPTRIQFLFEIIAEQITNEPTDDKAHTTYRYFNEHFKKQRQSSNIEKTWVEDIWNEVREIFQYFDEWYHDPLLFHYVGYLITVNDGNQITKELINKWKAKNKNEFVSELKEMIKTHIQNHKHAKDWINKLDDYTFDEAPNGESRPSKTECTDLLLLHNVETVIRQNERIKTNTKYNLPNFVRFAFHLYKKDNWQVEHIRPNHGNIDQFRNTQGKPRIDDMKHYIEYAKLSISFSPDEENQIKDFIDACNNKGTISDEEIFEKFEVINNSIMNKDGGIPDEERNKIFNFTLLDGSTNAGYGNYIFQVKRLYLREKEFGNSFSPGKATANSVAAGQGTEEDAKNLTPYILPCTRNIFTKYYTDYPTSYIMWTTKDAKYYLKNIKEVLDYYLT